MVPNCTNSADADACVIGPHSFMSSGVRISGQAITVRENCETLSLPLRNLQYRNGIKSSSDWHSRAVPVMVLKDVLTQITQLSCLQKQEITILRKSEYDDLMNLSSCTASQAVLAVVKCLPYLIYEVVLLRPQLEATCLSLNKIELSLFEKKRLLLHGNTGTKIETDWKLLYPLQQYYPYALYIWRFLLSLFAHRNSARTLHNGTVREYTDGIIFKVYLCLSVQASTRKTALIRV